MKNKVIALSLLITALSVVPVFADTNSNCNSIDLNNLNSSCYILKKGVGISNIFSYNSSNKNCNTIISDILNGYFNNGGTTNKPETPDVEKPETPDVEKPEVNVPDSVSSYERQVVELVNAERAKNGLSPLTLDASVSKVAKIKSQDMATNNYFSHTSPTYGNAGQMLTQFGIKYTAYGENIAAGQKTPQQVVNAWMNSSGHRANILSSAFTKIGVGYVTNSSGKAYWTQMFIR